MSAHSCSSLGSKPSSLHTVRVSSVTKPAALPSIVANADGLNPTKDSWGGGLSILNHLEEFENAEAGSHWKENPGVDIENV